MKANYNPHKLGIIYINKKGEAIACSTSNLKLNLKYLDALKKIKPSDIQKTIKEIFPGKLEKELK